MLYRKILLTGVFIAVCLQAIAQDTARVRNNIRVLCSPQTAGRGYAFEGDKKAAQHIARAFREAGVQPFGKDYFQPFPITANVFEGDMQLKIDRRHLRVGTDFVPNSVSGKGKGSAKLIFLDSLATKTDSAALQMSYKGKAVAFRMRDYYRLLERFPELIPHLNRAKVWIGISPDLTVHISGQALQPPFFIVKPEALGIEAQKVAFKIDSRLKKDYVTQNVIGYIKGTTFPQRFVVFTAHYDHLGTLGKDAYVPGANDNAAGVALLIELAHYFREKPPPFSVALMAFSGEELGLLGSTYYTAHPLFPLSHIRFLWNLDLIGTGKDGAVVVNGTLHAEEFARLQHLNDSLHALPKIVPRAPAANSDHYPFSVKGVPAFFIYLTDKDYRHYHDTAEQPEKLPLDGFVGLFRLLVQASLRLF